MGAEQSAFQTRRMGLDQDLQQAIFARALLEALQEGSSGESSEVYEHAWDPNDCSPPFVVLRDRLTARRRPSILTTDCIRGKKGYRNGRHVWEIVWEKEERGSFAIVGVATPRAPLQSIGYEPLIGSNTESWGWDIVSKSLWHGGKRGNYPPAVVGFQVPDTFFVILDMEEGTLSFATSNVHLGVAFTGLPKRQLNRPMCPVVNAIFGNCDIRMRYMGRGESLISNLRHPFSLHRSVSEAAVKTAEPPASRRKSTGSPGLDSSVVDASTRYKFAHEHGENAAVMYAGKKAKRVDALGSFCDGVVITSEPLRDNELFEVRLDSKCGRWMGSFYIGATTNDSKSLRFPDVMLKCTQGHTFLWSGNQIIYDRNTRKTVRENTDSLTTGDRIGVMRKPDNSLHFFLNGKDIGNCFKTIPDVLYGVVDIFGQAEQVTITGGTAETQSSNDGSKKGGQVEVRVMVQMKKVIFLMQLPVKQSAIMIIKMLMEEILQPYLDTQIPAVRQRYGDHLADIGAVQELKKFLERLDDIGVEKDEGWYGMSIVRSILWNYSDASLKMGKEIGKSGLLRRFINEMKRFGITAPRNEKKKSLLDSAVSILHNCAKATENRQVFRDINAVEILAPFLKSEDSEIVTVALLTMSYIVEENQNHLLETDTKTIGILRGMLDNATNSPRLRGSTDVSGSWSAHEIVSGITNIAVNEKNRINLIDADVIPLLFDVIEKGGPIEKECAANALWVLAEAMSGKKKIREYSGAMAKLNELKKDPNKGIAAAADRVLQRIKIQPMQQGSSRNPRKNCQYKEACRAFMTTLNVPDAAFDSRYHKCYCTDCHASRNEKLFYVQGKPAKDYAIPIGWCRFALHMERTAFLHKANTDWHVAYHGTHPDSVKPILDVGQLLIPGDTALGGKKLEEVDGHFKDDNKPEGFNTKQVFVSPSIRYSGLDVYAKTKEFTDPQSKKIFKAKVAFQLWIKPESYKVGEQTVGATEEIDPKFSNQEIEWSTVERGAVHLYGLLVRLD